MDPKNHQPANLFIYHILPRSDWAKAQASGIYEPESLTTEGFIHCSLSDQVIRVANAYYAGQKDLLLLRIDMGKLVHEVRYEDLLDEGECFPHIYGELNLSAVTAICPLGSDQHCKAGIDVVVMLTQPKEVQRLIGMNLAKRYQELGFDVIRAPIADFSVPEVGALNKPIRETLRAARDGQTIVIHCHAGLGRTGMFAACLAKVVFGMDGMEARAWVRQHIRHAVETVEQLEYILSFELSEE